MLYRLLYGRHSCVLYGNIFSVSVTVFVLFFVVFDRVKGPQWMQHADETAIHKRHFTMH